MGRFGGLEEEMQGETRGNHSTGRCASLVATSKGDGNFSDTPHGIEALLTSREASRVLKIHPKVLERMAKRGEVPALKVGKFWRYRATALDAWINSRLQSRSQVCRIATSF